MAYEAERQTSIEIRKFFGPRLTPYDADARLAEIYHRAEEQGFTDGSQFDGVLSPDAGTVPGEFRESPFAEVWLKGWEQGKFEGRLDRDSILKQLHESWRQDAYRP